MSDSFGNRISTRLRSLNPEQMAAFGRTIAQTLAGILGSWFALDEQYALSIASGVVWTAITWWGVWARKDTNLLASAANVPTVKAVVVDSAVVAEKVPDPKVATPPEVRRMGVV